MKYNIVHIIRGMICLMLGIFLYHGQKVQAQSQATPNQQQAPPIQEMTFTIPDAVHREVPKQKGRVAPSEVTIVLPQNGQTAAPAPVSVKHYLDNATRADQLEEIPLILYNSTLKTPE